MKTATRRTIFSAVLLTGLAAAAPFLCLIPLFSPGSDTAEQVSPTPGQTAATPAPTPLAEPQAILLWDEASGQAVSVPAREYLMGAAACEMPIDWPDDALQAQMVASHSWALYQLDHSDGSGTAISVNSAQCSGWTSGEVLQSRWGSDFDANWQRLGELADQVLRALVLYDGEPAAACYHAISSGHTQASQRVWAESLPYLQGVDSAWDAQGRRVRGEHPVHRPADGPTRCTPGWASRPPATRTAGWATPSGTMPGMWTPSPLCGVSAGGTQVRSALNLRSALLCHCLAGRVLHRDEPGATGHGVGLSQAGARAMAAGGSSWRDILAYYFPGTEIREDAAV